MLAGEYIRHAYDMYKTVQVLPLRLVPILQVLADVYGKDLRDPKVLGDLTRARDMLVQLERDSTVKYIEILDGEMSIFGENGLVKATAVRVQGENQRGQLVELQATRDKFGWDGDVKVISPTTGRYLETHQDTISEIPYMRITVHWTMLLLKS